MSFQAMAWAVKQKVGNATGKAILLTLANYADEQGQCFPSQNTLASECECSTRAVSNWLSKFEDMGIIARETRHGQRGYRTSDFIQLDINNQHARRSPEYNSCENGSVPTCTTFRSNMHDVQSNNLSVKQSDNLSDTKAREAKKQFEAEFNQTFWPAYPHKVGKPVALKAFLKARTESPLQEIMGGLDRYIKTKEGWRHWMHPSTFLNGKHWNDQPATITEQNHASGNSQPKSPGRKFSEAVFDLCNRQGLDPFKPIVGEDISTGFHGWDETERGADYEDPFDDPGGPRLALVANNSR